MVIVRRNIVKAKIEDGCDAFLPEVAKGDICKVYHVRETQPIAANLKLKNKLMRGNIRISCAHRARLATSKCQGIHS